MMMRLGALALTTVTAFGITAARSQTNAKRAGSEQQLESRAGRETNPAKKAKIEIALGRLKLGNAVGAYNGDRFDEGSKFLDAYWGQMKQAWALLEQSGRDPVRKPQGFKDLDIALREDARTLEDLKHRTPYADRNAINRVAGEVDALHAEVLVALFPGGKPKEPGDPAKPAAAQDFTLRPFDAKP
jgi:hypothetical protein